MENLGRKTAFRQRRQPELASHSLNPSAAAETHHVTA